MDRHWLTTVFMAGTLVTIKGVTGWISTIEREDGSGWSFNLKITDKKGQSHNVYLRCPVNPPS